MTIGIVLDDTLDKVDGVQAAILVIGSELERRGHSVHYLVAHTERTDLAHVHSLSKFIALRFNGNSVRTPLPISSKKIKALFSEISFDVLHVQLPYSPFLAGRIINAAPKHTKIIGTFHILPYGKLSVMGTKILGKIVSLRSLRRLSTFLAVSEPALDFMKDMYSVKGQVLPNPINYEYFSKFRVMKKTGHRSVVFVGRFDERKGVRQLITAYAQLPEKIRSSVELILCGKGPLLEEIKKFSEKHKLAVKFPGFVTEQEKARYLADASIAVFPSTAGESFGIVLVEAMAAGATITLGGRNPGYQSVLAPWPDTLFDPNNIAEFTETLVKALTTERVKNISISQHDYVEQFAVERVVDKLLRIYTT